MSSCELPSSLRRLGSLRLTRHGHDLEGSDDNLSIGFRVELVTQLAKDEVKPSSLRRDSRAGTTWYDSEGSYDDLPKVYRAALMLPWTPLAKLEVNPSTCPTWSGNAASHGLHDSLVPRAKAIRDVHLGIATRTASLDSSPVTVINLQTQCGFRCIASPDFLSRTSSVASIKDQNDDNSESIRSGPSVMLAALQGAKMHRMSKSHSADILVPSILPFRFALNANSASLLPESPLFGSPVNSPHRNARGDKQSTDSMETTKRKRNAPSLVPVGDEDDITAHGWAVEDDRKMMMSGSKTSYFKQMTAYLGLSRNTAAQRSKTM